MTYTSCYEGQYITTLVLIKESKQEYLTPLYRRVKLLQYATFQNVSLLNDLYGLPFELDPMLQLLLHWVI